MSLWSAIAFFLNIMINVIVASFYPYKNNSSLGERYLRVTLLGVVNGKL